MPADDQKSVIDQTFSKIDSNNDDLLTRDEIIRFLKENHVAWSDAKIEKLISSIQHENQGITLGEWKKFFRSQNIVTESDLLHYWVIGSVPPKHQWTIAISGSIAGIVSRTCTAPLDRLKIYLQTDPSKSNISNIIKIIYQENGIRSFWRGNLLNCLKVMPESALKFHFFEYSKEILPDVPSSRFLAGSIAGFISQLAIYPLETLKTRYMIALQQNSKQKASIFDVAKSVNKFGFFTFYRGAGPALIGIIPYAGIDLGTYESLKGLYRNITGQPPMVAGTLGIGMVSASVSASIVYPLNLIRTRYKILI
eukprot:NODE_494_length_7750_cov_0.325317.p2 type:complete len:309 gc:universal NODE_494_length_7750_cov_0.325317:1893-967(-)